jgi:hypothetical protein
MTPSQERLLLYCLTLGMVLFLLYLAVWGL